MNPTIPTQYTPDDYKAPVLDALSDFWAVHYEGTLQIFHSLTIGEIVIAVLLGLIVLIHVFKWIWEVFRYG